MDNDTPITRADLTAALTAHESRILERIEKSETNLESRILERIEKSETNLEVRILERIEKSETNLLNAFRSWARRSETRTKANSILVNSFDERLGDLEDQVAEIKDKIR